MRGADISAPRLDIAPDRLWVAISRSSCPPISRPHDFLASGPHFCSIASHYSLNSAPLQLMPGRILNSASDEYNTRKTFVRHRANLLLHQPVPRVITRFDIYNP